VRGNDGCLRLSLTTFAQRHGGKVPNDYIANTLKNGVEKPGHGSGEMPVWGPIF
jgi:hypothetical protein